jgi:hypothetical protein
MPLKCIYIDGMHKNTTAICDNDFFPSSELWKLVNITE